MIVWRWLLAKGRLDQFRREIEFGAKWTGVKLDQALLTGETGDVRTSRLLAESDQKREGNNVSSEAKEVGFLDILKSKTLLPRLLVKRWLYERKVCWYIAIIFRQTMSTGQQSTFVTTASP